MERTHDANESFEYSAGKKVFILDTFILLARPLTVSAVSCFALVETCGTGWKN